MGVFWRFLSQFSKMTDYNQFIFSGTLVHSNIFRLRLIRAFCDAWFAQNEFLTEVKLAISGVQFRLLHFFNIFNSSDFAHIPHLSFPIDIVYNGENRLSISFFIFEKAASKHWGTLKNSSNFEQRERKYANTWGGGGRARGQTSFQNHSYCIAFVIITICVHSALTFIRL